MGVKNGNKLHRLLYFVRKTENRHPPLRVRQCQKKNSRQGRFNNTALSGMSRKYAQREAHTGHEPHYRTVILRTEHVHTGLERRRSKREFP